MLDYSTREYNPKLTIKNSTLLFNFTHNAKYYPKFSINSEGSRLVIAIRGSASQYDLDTLVDSAELRTQYGTFPAGYYRASINTFNKIGYYLNQKYSEIYITGHSYGASVAHILNLIIHYYNHSINNVYSVGFGPVPSIDYEGSLLIKNYSATIINAHDYVSTNSINIHSDYIRSTYGTVSGLTKDQINNTFAQLLNKFDDGTKINLKPHFMSLLTEQTSDIYDKLTNKKVFRLSTVPGGKCYWIGMSNTNNITETIVDQNKQINRVPQDPHSIIDHYLINYIEHFSKYTTE
ncbi:Lipase family protein [Trichomonas vaginalis G3]|uniref:sn-1-specific diacylglycerol lipase n=1 Tax=Trichomonas vaginalis (strain ATCC PRA-98 / G3) TaxID=412133 RepID=A2F2W5_TRIV3|nr:lipase [Trichomonas vaginalis G3]EAY00758.1 Lipase family protein [Trichomonas vaginalis G3]KAI5530738.1 diacylglycerol lipase homolog-related family [Trichomonas vaginalis G3]|eukprot:XP_001313687.1 lipase [Trichomonas vaginalis G3]